MAETTMLEVRVLPWRPRARVMRASTLREMVTSPDALMGADGIAGIVVGLALCVGVFVAAPLVVLLLAAVLLPFELTALLAVAGPLLVARFCGVMPWTVLTVDPGTGEEARSRHRTLWGAVRRVRATSGRGRVAVRWSWA